MGCELDVRALVGRHPAVRSVELAGSRAEGRANERSDWDFVVVTDDFSVLAADLPELCAPLGPLAQQWDRLSPYACWMLMLPGPTKVDLIFPEEPYLPEPPWEATRESLVGIDRHFWDWALWLRSKEAAGKEELVTTELEKLYVHLLEPLGATRRPRSVADAVGIYREARADAERRFDCEVPRELETAVADAVLA